MLLTTATPGALLERSITTLVDSIEAAVPKIVTALVFLVVAGLIIWLVLMVVRAVLGRVFRQNDLIRDLLTTVVGVLLWFGVILTLLKIVGMGDIAASFGTAAGFVALGVSYALSDMIADTVSGVYLLRDPDFNPGDRVEIEGTTGTVRSIDLRKSRFELDSGDTLIMANRDVESGWTKLVGEP